MWDGFRCLAVVPARGGSKGIPRKNLRQVGGRSLIAWAGALTAALPWLDAAILTTDDEEIAAEGRACNLDVPFLRPAELASDEATGLVAWQHAWRGAEAHYGMPFELSILLQPTTPLRRAVDVETTLRTLVDGGYDVATTVAPVPGHFVTRKQLRIEADGSLSPLTGEPLLSNRQDAGAAYYRTGACYAAWRRTVVEEGRLMDGRCAAVTIEAYTPNIDEEHDLLLADAMAREGWTLAAHDPKAKEEEP